MKECLECQGVRDEGALPYLTLPAGGRGRRGREGREGEALNREDGRLLSGVGNGKGREL